VPAARSAPPGLCTVSSTLCLGDKHVLSLKCSINQENLECQKSRYSILHQPNRAEPHNVYLENKKQVWFNGFGFVAIGLAGSFDE